MTKENKIHFPNAPVVEIIAELKWGNPTFVLPPAKSSQQVLFDKFAAEIATKGYQRSELLVPPNFPLAPFQPVYRYRNDSDTTLFQIGTGIFSANVTPPYRSWEEFSPILKMGIDALLSIPNNNEPINRISLRYINAFQNNLTQGKKIIDFLSEILGFHFQLPEILQEQAKSADEIIPQIQLVIPLKEEQQMTLIIGKGKINNEEVILMDITISYIPEIPPQITKDIMETFNSAHQTIHTIFISMTSKLHQLMQGNNRDE